ncbi:hypothetical protein Q5762_07970 [Streptomyces sp. P9(2023)]|uniref:hypothetical protein n=1 Tax=Streptomyces sp. P9(2023) TaxID=3064394 RepID=UPI0028F42641|nr:hypothetical protein [Streptomyces sp. P9(2023)]MDT9688292.1 hypothetical protein [Streptomyces sp. P9(2023)]
MAPSSTHRRARTAAATVCAVVTVATAGLTAGFVAPAAWAQPATPTAAVAAPTPDPFANLTPDAIADRAVDATQSATSLRITGRVVSEDQPLDIDIALDDKNNCTGRMKVDGGTAELRQADRITYLKGDEKFWRVSMTSQGVPPPQIDATIELVEGRWLKITPGQAGSSDLSGVCDLDALLTDLGEDKDERQGLTRGPDAEVEGTPVATLVKKEPGGETTTVSVAQEGKPYILKMVKTGGEEPGTVVLSDYDKPVKVVVPPADETVDLTKLDPGTRA